MRDDVVYIDFDQFVLAASVATGLTEVAVRRVADRSLAESALRAPGAAFLGRDEDEYPGIEDKAAVLLERLARNHPLPDGNKRAALLCTILFVNLNGYDWNPPALDVEDGRETAEVVEAASQGHIPHAPLAAWIRERLVAMPLAARVEPEGAGMVIYPAEYVGSLGYEENAIHLGDLVVHDVHGFNPAGVYVRRIGGKTEGISVAQIVISVVGDAYAEEQLNAENAEADRYPLGPKEYWRTKLVGHASYADGHVMTDAEFEDEWGED